MKFIHLSDTHILARDDYSRYPDAAATLRKIIGEINKYHRDAEICVITGDITQVDLPRGTKSGLAHVIQVLKDVPGIGFTHFLSKDVVRHPLVQRIVEAYDRFEVLQEIEREERKNEQRKNEH